MRYFFFILALSSVESCTKSEDKPNNVMKMMRMTSEWHSVKKNLLDKSHQQTSFDADNILGSVVKVGVYTLSIQVTVHQINSFFVSM